MEEARETMPPTSTKYQLKFEPTRVVCSLYLSLSLSLSLSLGSRGRRRMESWKRKLATVRERAGYRLPLAFGAVQPPPFAVIRGKILLAPISFRLANEFQLGEFGRCERLLPRARNALGDE